MPRVVFNLRVLCDRYFGCRPLVVGKPDCKLPVAPRVDAGTTVGPDRLVNTVAGFDRHGGDLIVVEEDQRDAKGQRSAYEASLIGTPARISAMPNVTGPTNCHFTQPWRPCAASRKARKPA